MSHSAGLSYGVFDPGTAIFKAYNERKVLNPATTLAEMIDVLADLPLVYHPGTSWEYSVATDVLARLVEIVSGEGFDKFIQSKILGPLGMVDTGFVVPEQNRSRLVAYYAGALLGNRCLFWGKVPFFPAQSRRQRPEQRLAQRHQASSQLPILAPLRRASRL
jgi:CubicO group peptidase (beta-lactamase class C family)